MDRAEAGDGVIEIPRDILEQMVRHAVEELPNEACGLLAGPDGTIERFYPMRNSDQSPTTYRLDGADQLRVFNEIEDRRWELKAIFHSHPHTEAIPSKTDREQAFYPEAYYLVASLADRDRPAVRGFSIRDGEVHEREVRIV